MTSRSWVRGADLPRVVRFLAAGGIAFAVDFGTLVLTHSGLHVTLQWAIVCAYAVGGIVHYTLTRFWVFPARERHQEAQRVIRYLILAAFNMGATVGLVTGLADIGVDYRLGKIICVAVLMVINYLATPRFVIRDRPAP